MIQTKKISFLIIILLVNFLITSCGGCSKKKGDPLVREEKRLKSALKEQCKETTWKNLEGSFEQDRSDASKINQHIQGLLALQGRVDNLVNFITPLVPKMKNKTLGPQEKQELQSLLDFLSPLKICPEEFADKKIDDLLKQDPSSLQKKFRGLVDPALISVIKTFLTNQLDLWRNLKQQLDQKSTEGNSDSN